MIIAKAEVSVVAAYERTFSVREVATHHLTTTFADFVRVHKLRSEIAR